MYLNGQDGLLKFKLSIEMWNNGDVSDLGCVIIVGARLV